MNKSMKTSEILRLYRDGQRNFQGLNLRGGNFTGQDLSGGDFSYCDIRGANFTKANLREAKFVDAKAGVQFNWAIGLVIVSLLVATISGLASGLAGIFPSGTLGPNFIKQHGTFLPGVITYLVLTIFFIVTIQQGFTRVLVITAGAVGGALAVALALTWVLAVTEDLARMGTVVRAVAGVLAVTAVLIGAGSGFGALAFTLAEAGKNPNDGAMKKLARRATTMLKGIISGLPNAAKLVEECNKLIPMITKIFGL